MGEIFSSFENIIKAIGGFFQWLFNGLGNGFQGPSLMETITSMIMKPKIIDGLKENASELAVAMGKQPQDADYEAIANKLVPALSPYAANTEALKAMGGDVYAKMSDVIFKALPSDEIKSEEARHVMADKMAEKFVKERLGNDAPVVPEIFTAASNQHFNEFANAQINAMVAQKPIPSEVNREALTKMLQTKLTPLLSDGTLTSLMSGNATDQQKDAMVTKLRNSFSDTDIDSIVAPEIQSKMNPELRDAIRGMLAENIVRPESQQLAAASQSLEQARKDTVRGAVFAMVKPAVSKAYDDTVNSSSVGWILPAKWFVSEEARTTSTNAMSKIVTDTISNAVNDPAQAQKLLTMSPQDRANYLADQVGQQLLQNEKSLGLPSSVSLKDKLPELQKKMAETLMASDGEMVSALQISGPDMKMIAANAGVNGAGIRHDNVPLPSNGNTPAGGPPQTPGGNAPSQVAINGPH